ncbi:hypothetical protein K2W90_05230 [Candidatus Babeliales bacterium]|nr:hypothetical protein [Candidatus Babeliales bacterium]
MKRPSLLLLFFLCVASNAQGMKFFRPSPPPQNPASMEPQKHSSQPPTSRPAPRPVTPPPAQTPKTWLDRSVQYHEQLANINRKAATAPFWKKPFYQTQAFITKQKINYAGKQAFDKAIKTGKISPQELTELKQGNATKDMQVARFTARQEWQKNLQNMRTLSLQSEKALDAVQKEGSVYSQKVRDRAVRAAEGKLSPEEQKQIGTLSAEETALLKKAATNINQKIDPMKGFSPAEISAWEKISEVKLGNGLNEQFNTLRRESYKLSDKVFEAERIARASGKSYVALFPQGSQVSTPKITQPQPAPHSTIPTTPPSLASQPVTPTPPATAALAKEQQRKKDEEYNQRLLAEQSKIPQKLQRSQELFQRNYEAELRQKAASRREFEMFSARQTGDPKLIAKTQAKHDKERAAEQPAIDRANAEIAAEAARKAAKKQPASTLAPTQP